MEKRLYFKVKTTGLDVMSDHIVNVDVLTTDNEGRILNKITRNILLPEGVEMSDEICAHNMMTNDVLRMTGIPFEQFMNEFKILADDCDTLVTYNGESFDMRIFYEQCKRYGINPIIHKYQSIDLFRVYKENTLFDFTSVFNALVGGDKIEGINRFTQKEIPNVMSILEMHTLMIIRGFEINPIVVISLDGSLRKNENGEIVFARGKHANELLTVVFKNDLNYIKYMLENHFYDDITAFTIKTAYKNWQSAK